MDDVSRSGLQSLAFAAWLASRSPEAELAMRYAMRVLFPELKDDVQFNARLVDLAGRVKPTSDKFIRIANRALELEAVASRPWDRHNDGVIESLGTARGKKHMKPTA